MLRINCCKPECDTEYSYLGPDDLGELSAHAMLEPTGISAPLPSETAKTPAKILAQQPCLKLVTRGQKSLFMPGAVECLEQIAILDLNVSPGDVLCIRPGTAGAMTQLGARGGFMGHVVLVTEAPRCMSKFSAEAFEFRHVWPPGIKVVWFVKTLESTRFQDGFHEALVLLYFDDAGRLYFFGEDDPNSEQFFVSDKPEEVQVWRCPASLRQYFRYDIMQEVLASMRKHEASWSWSTAVRAVFLSAQVPANQDEAKTLQLIQKSWTADPICTSVVIVFWQRYLSRLAEISSEGNNNIETDPLTLIADVMPLWGDRTLPGELLSTMEKCGWSVSSEGGRRLTRV